MTDCFDPASLDKRVLDFELFRERMMEDDDLMREVAIAMIEDSPAQIDSLKRFLSDNNWIEAGKAGHKIKGGAANLCCRELEEAAFMVEQAGKAGDQGRLMAASELLFAAWARLEPVLRKIWQ